MDHESPRDPSRDKIYALNKAIQESGKAFCDDCISQLSDYVDAQLEGQDYQALFPEVAIHLDACLECARAYARLYELELAVRAGHLPQTNSIPVPNLVFLSSGTTQSRSTESTPSGSKSTSLLDRLRASLEWAGDLLTFHLSPDLFILLQPAQATASLRAAGQARYSEILLQLEPQTSMQSELPFRMVAYRDAQNPEMALVEITWMPPGREWPDLAGATVIFSFNDKKRQETTDSWGLAIFENIPVSDLPTMTVQIKA